jgi:stage V sporulation protein B
MLKKFVNDIGLSFIAQTTNMLLGFAIILILGRYLGPEDLGLYRMTFTIYTLTVLFAGIGLPAALLKYIAEKEEDGLSRSQILTVGIVNSVLIGIILVFVYITFAGSIEEFFKMPGLESLVLILAPVFPFALLNNILLGYFNGRRQMKTFAVSTILQSVVMLSIGVALILLGFGAVSAVFGITLSSAVNSLYLYSSVRREFHLIFSQFIDYTKELSHFGFNILVTSALDDINSQLDILFIGYFLFAGDLGFYSVAVGLSRFFWIIPLSVQKITFPATSTFWQAQNHHLLRSMLEKTVKMCTIILVPMGFLVSAFSKEIIVLLFGQEYLYAIIPFQILIIGTVFRGSLAQPVGASLSGIGRPDLVMKVSMLTLAINAVLDYFLITTIGINGAAIATSISFITGSLIVIYLNTKFFGTHFEVKWYFTIFCIFIVSIPLMNVVEDFTARVFIALLFLGSYLAFIYKSSLTDDEKDIISFLLKDLYNSR